MESSDGQYDYCRKTSGRSCQYNAIKKGITRYEFQVQVMGSNEFDKLSKVVTTRFLETRLGSLLVRQHAKGTVELLSNGDQSNGVILRRHCMSKVKQHLLVFDCRHETWLSLA